jgi:anti-sigma regulatory factor (Ser/Thr protein kinase)
MTRFEASTVATSAAITDLTDRVMEFLKAHGVEVRPTHHTALVLSEVLTNLGMHGGHQDPVRVAVAVAPDAVTGEIIDRGPPFDPKRAPDPSIDFSAEDRPIGGLGLYLVRKLSCGLEYESRNGENCMTFVIKRAGAHSEGKDSNGNS